jgi:hypothetical protein
VGHPVLLKATTSFVHFLDCQKSARPPHPAGDGIPTVKLVLLASRVVGQTSIMTVAYDGDFAANQIATVAACFHVKKMKVATPRSSYMFRTPSARSDFVR